METLNMVTIMDTSDLGEKYKDKFVTVDNSPITNLYDFDEFSYFGRDSLYNPLSLEKDLYDYLNNLRAWAKNVENNKENQSLDVAEDTSEDIPEDALEEPYALPEVPKAPTASIVSTTLPNGKFNVQAAVDTIHYLTHYELTDRYDKSKWKKKNTHDTGHKCSRAVTLALEAGGLDVSKRAIYGGNQGPYLLSTGWQLLPDNITNFKPGDLCVIKGLGSKDKYGNYMGHICMYDGKLWVSDFYLNSWDVYHGKAKRGVNTHFYRYMG